ncbi:MAG TPA: NYN domain-containing protein, partial [Symbiobacteriaceae bacterium]|nr:NYN domain-containing protein [Symbiobacteriaceae bacterium]
ALFIDYENVFKSLRGQNINTTHKQLAEIFKAEANRFGEVTYARAYAPWDIFPEAMSVFDRHDIKPEYVEGGRKDNADLVMSLEIQESLRIPARDADTFILVTGDGDFVHVIRLLQQEKKRVVVWGVEGSISTRLAARVAELVNIQTLLADHGVVPGLTGFGDNGTQRPTRPEGPPSKDTPTRALIVRSESVMLGRGWVQVPFLTLMHEMSTSNLFGEDSEQRRLLIVRCLEEGILETKKQPNPKRPGTETTFVLLKKENPTVTHTLRAVSRVILHMRQILSSMPGATWVAYGLLDKALASDPSMPQGPAGEPERRAWIDLCIAEGVLRLERKENPKNPEFPTSALFLSEEHALVQQVVPGEDHTPMLRRLIIHMDHYLTRTGYMWMSMGLLRQQLGIYGQKEMERAIRVANESGVIIIRQQPNQFGSRPTTGAYVQLDNPVVLDVLGLRDKVLDRLLQVYSDRDVVMREPLEMALAETVGYSEPDPMEWLQLLVNHQILAHSATAEGENGYSLNRQHPVVARRNALVS